MKKHLLMFAVVALVVAITMPAFAAVEFKYGGQFRWRVWAEDNVRDGVDSSDAQLTTPVFTRNLLNPGGALLPQLPLYTTYNGDDRRWLIDQRLRLYFTFAASKNLKVVTKFEMGDAVWGKGAPGNIGRNLGGDLGGDSISFEVKNAYMEFNIPNTPSTAIIGLQGVSLLDSWIFDDDVAAAILTTKLDPFKITIGYMGAQHAWESAFNSNVEFQGTDERFNVDNVFMSLDYASGPFKASLIGFFQDGHNSTWGYDPTINTPVTNFAGLPAFNATTGVVNSAASFPFSKGLSPRDNFLFDLGLNLTYKVDWLLAYVNFVHNFGSVDFVVDRNISTNGIANPANGLPANFTTSADYNGYMIDAGVTYFCGPYTVNVGGFYTSGPDFTNNPGNGLASRPDLGIANPATGDGGTAADGTGTFVGMASKDIDWFVMPVGGGKYSSEIMGGGVLGDDFPMASQRGFDSAVLASAMGLGRAMSTVYWRSFSQPTNVWTITAGGSWQVMEQTKISASYWYWHTSNDVPVAYVPNAVLPNPLDPLDTGGRYQMDGSIGHEFNFYLDQGIVDGLTLTLVGAYMIADDAFAPITLPVTNNTPAPIPNHASDAYKIGARLQWNF